MVFRYDCSTNERAPLRLESSNFRKLVRSGVLLALIAMFRQARAGETLTGLGTLVPSGVIFSAKQTEQIKQTHRFIPISSPFWTPTDKDVALIQSKLPFYLKNWSPTAEAISELEPGLDKAEFDRKSKEIAKNLKSYRLQYLGYSVADRRMIMINGFCEEYWRKARSLLVGTLCWYGRRWSVFFQCRI